MRKNKKDFEQKKIKSIFFVNYSGLIYLPTAIVLPRSNALQFIRACIYINVRSLLYSLRRRLPSYTTETFSSVAIYYFFFPPHEGEITSLPTSHNISVC